MQICNENDEPINGLYAAGSMIGDMFANCYNFRIAGHNYGCCLTFGYLTGKYIAGNQDG
jgi:roadblock/LC7 domain-containing protein